MKFSFANTKTLYTSFFENTFWRFLFSNNVPGWNFIRFSILNYNSKWISRLLPMKIFKQINIFNQCFDASSLLDRFETSNSLLMKWVWKCQAFCWWSVWKFEAVYFIDCLKIWNCWIHSTVWILEAVFLIVSRLKVNFCSTRFQVEDKGFANTGGE